MEIENRPKFARTKLMTVPSSHSIFNVVPSQPYFVRRSKPGKKLTKINKMAFRLIRHVKRLLNHPPVRYVATIYHSTCCTIRDHSRMSSRKFTHFLIPLTPSVTLLCSMSYALVSGFAQPPPPHLCVNVSFGIIKSCNLDNKKFAS